MGKNTNNYEQMCALRYDIFFNFLSYFDENKVNNTSVNCD